MLVVNTRSEEILAAAVILSICMSALLDSLHILSCVKDGQLVKWQGGGGRDGKNVYTEAIRLEKIPARGNHQETPIDVKIIPANRVERN